MVDRLDAVSVRIEQEGTVVVVAVLGPRAGPAVALVSGRRSRLPEPVDVLPRRGREADVQPPVTGVRVVRSREREVVPLGVVLAAVGLLDLERAKHRLVEALGRLAVGGADRDVVEHAGERTGERRCADVDAARRCESDGARPGPGPAGQRSFDAPWSRFGQSWSPELPAYPCCAFEVWVLAAGAFAAGFAAGEEPPASAIVAQIAASRITPASATSRGNDVSCVPLPWASFRRVPTGSESRRGQGGQEIRSCGSLMRELSSATDRAASARAARTGRPGGAARRSRARRGRR